MMLAARCLISGSRILLIHHKSNGNLILLNYVAYIMVGSKFVLAVTSVFLASGLSIAGFSVLTTTAAAHECPPEGCIADGRMTGGGETCWRYKGDTWL
jgi:hypothetical protein